MADLTIASVLTSSRTEGHGRGRVSKDYTITFDAGADYPAADVAFDITAAVNSNKIERAGWARVPDGFEVLNHPLGYLAVIIPGTALTDWKIRLYGGNGAGDVLLVADGTVALSTKTMRVRLSGVAV